MAETKKSKKASSKKGGSPSRGSGEPRRSSKGAGGIRIKLVRSVIGCTRHQREVVRGLGLRRINHTVERVDTPEVRGMISKVTHLIELLEA
jgi:large subunit ribosomal protein L30